MYAIKSENKNADAFNCYQRGHQNALETVAIFIVSLGIASLNYPLIAGLCGIIFSISKIIYAWGYYNGPGGRVFGGLLGYFALWVLVGVSLVTCAREMGIFSTIENGILDKVKAFKQEI